MISLSSTKPFAKKTFFLDLKGFLNENKLAQDLKLLGGKQELSMSKNVSFVVSNKIPLRSQLWSPVTPSSNPRSMSPHLFNDSTMDDCYSPAYTDSPGIEQTSCIMSRGKSILQMAKEKKTGTSSIMDICKKWKIKVYHIQKVLSWVEKYKSLYYKNHLTQQKNAVKKFPVASESVQRIHSPFIKIEDKARKYKPKYKVLTSWTDVIDPAVSHFVSQLHKNLIATGNINDSFRPPLRKLNIKSLGSAQSALITRSVSISKMSLISNSVSVYAPNDGGKENFSHSHVKRKGKDNKKKTKKRYCEICDVHFTDFEKHVGKTSHERYMNNTDHYREVQDIISSLPQVEDFLKSIQDEIDQEAFQDYLFEDVPGGETALSGTSQLLFQGNCAENCMTELYSINPDDYISASCSSTDSSSFPYLEPIYNDNIVENQCDKDLCPPTIVYCSTVECTGNYFRKSLLENLGIEDVDNIVPNFNKMCSNTVENNQLSNYGSGSNSCDLKMEDVCNQKQISNNSFLCALRNEMNVENIDMPVTRNVLNFSGAELEHPTLSHVNNLNAVKIFSDSVNCNGQNVESKFPHLSDSLDVVSNYSSLVIQDVSCSEVPLPSLICTKTNLSTSINYVTNGSDKKQVVEEPVENLAITKRDVQDSFTNKGHGFLSEQNRFPSKINRKSHSTESSSESHLSCKKNEISTDSNISKDVKYDELKTIQTVSCSRNLVCEFESVALQTTSEVKNASVIIIKGDRLSEDEFISNKTCPADFTSENIPEFSKETQVLKYVDECHLPEFSIRDSQNAQSNTQKNPQISKRNSVLNDVDDGALNVGSPYKLHTLKDLSSEKLSTFNLSHVDILDSNKNEESLGMSIDTACSTAVPITPPSERVQLLVLKVDKNQFKVNENCKSPVCDLTSSTVQDERTTDDLPAHLNVINGDNSMNKSVNKTVKSNKSESISSKSLDKNEKTQTLVMANGYEMLPFKMESLPPDARKLLKHLFVKQIAESSDSLQQEKAIYSSEICKKDSEFFSTSTEDSFKTGLNVWNAENVFYVIDDVTPEKSFNYCNMDVCDDSVRVSTVDISYLDEQSGLNSHTYLNNYIPLAPIGNSVATVTLPSTSTVENMKEKPNIDFNVMGSTSDSRHILKQDVLNAGCCVQNLSVLNTSSGSKLEDVNCSNEADFSSSPEKQNDWDIIHHEVDTLCKSINAEEESPLDLSGFRRHDPLQLVMQH